MSTQPEGLSMYPSWYARYLLAFNNQLRCRERVQDLRYRLISEEQRYLDQASDRVREFVLAGKHTVRPLLGDNTPTDQPSKSHPLASKALPKRQPWLRPQQGHALPVEARDNSPEITHLRRRRRGRRKRRTPSPQYPTFCFEELVVRAEAEARREARVREMFRVPASSPVDMTTGVEDQDNQDASDIPVPLTLVNYYEAPHNSQMHENIEDVPNMRTRGPSEVRPPQNGQLQNSNNSFSPQAALPPLGLSKPKQSAMVARTSNPASITASDVNNTARTFDSNVVHHLVQPPNVVSNSSALFHNSPAGEAFHNLSKASRDTEEGHASSWQSPDAARRSEKLVNEEWRRFRRKEAHRRHLRKANRVNCSINLSSHHREYHSSNDSPEETKCTDETVHFHGNARQPNQNGEFPEIEAVRRWQLIGKEGRNKINKSMRNYRR